MKQRLHHLDAAAAFDWRKICWVFRQNACSLLYAAFKGDRATHDEARAMLDRMVELQKFWDDALVDAAKTNAAKENTAGDGSVQEQARGKYWRPELNADEWTLLNWRMETELDSEKQYLDESTKWLYAEENGVRVFALYGVGDGTEATPLYAVGGKWAAADYTAMTEYIERRKGYDGDGRSVDSWTELFWREKRSWSRNLSQAKGTAAVAGTVYGLHGGSSRGDGGRTSERGTQNQRSVKEKFSLREYSEDEKKLHIADARKFFGKTYKWAETGYLTPGGTKLDFSGRHDGAPGGYRTVDHLSANEQQKAAKKAIQEKFVGKVIGLTNRAFVNGNTAKEYAFPSKSIKDPNAREAKMRASTELDNLLEAGENFRTEPDGRDGHVHPNATGDFRYFDMLFKVGNEYYTGVINIMPVNKGLLLKDITKIRNVTKDITGSYGENPQSRFLRDASIDSIRSSGGNSQEKSGESALYQRRDSTRTERDVLSDAADGDAANVRETVTGAGCSAIWTDRPTGEKTFLAETAKESAADHGGVQHSDCQSPGGLGRDFRESASVS